MVVLSDITATQADDDDGRTIEEEEEWIPYESSRSETSGKRKERSEWKE